MAALARRMLPISVSLTAISCPVPLCEAPRTTALIVGLHVMDVDAVVALAVSLGAEGVQVGVAIIDANDIGVNILGTSPGVDAALVESLLRDNPLGQGAQQTPVALLRPV